MANQREVGPRQWFGRQLGNVARHKKGDDCSYDDTGENSRREPARHEDDGDQQTDHGYENRPRVQGRQGEQAVDGPGLPGNEGDYTGIAQPDEKEEKPDTDGDRPAERSWDNVHHVL